MSKRELAVSFCQKLVFLVISYFNYYLGNICYCILFRWLGKLVEFRLFTFFLEWLSSDKYDLKHTVQAGWWKCNKDETCGWRWEKSKLTIVYHGGLLSCQNRPVLFWNCLFYFFLVEPAFQIFTRIVEFIFTCCTFSAGSQYHATNYRLLFVGLCRQLWSLSAYSPQTWIARFGCNPAHHWYSRCKSCSSLSALASNCCARSSRDCRKFSAVLFPLICR